jgi:hypothetical protein
MLELAMPARAGRLALPDAPGGFLPPPEWPQVVQAIVLSLGFKLVPTLGDGRSLYHAAAIVMDWFDLVSNDDGNFYTHAGADAVAAGALAAMRAHEQMWRHVDEANWNLAVQIASGKGPSRVFPDPDCCVRGVACFIQRWVVVADCKLGSHQLASSSSRRAVSRLCHARCLGNPSCTCTSDQIRSRSSRTCSIR